MKTIQIRDTEVPLDLRAWTPGLRHFGSIVVMAAAALLLAVGFLVQFLAPAASAVILYVLLAVIVALLLFEVAIVVLGLRAETAAPAASRPASGPASAPAPAPAPARTGFERPSEPPAGDSEPEPESSVLTLKCGRCATEFDVKDEGERPLYHTCPGCGAEGVLRGAGGAPKPADEPPAAREPQPQPEPEAPADTTSGFAAPPSSDAPAPAAEDTNPRKRLKLRCGGCKGIFQVEDTGKRPLRHRCPHCNRLGEIK